MDSVSAAASRENEVRREGDNIVVALRGEWTLQTEQRKGDVELLNAVSGERDHAGVLKFDLSGLQSWDTSLLVVLSKLKNWCHQNQVQFSPDGLTEEISSLVTLSEAVPEKQTGKQEPPNRSLFYRLGKWALDLLEGVQVTFSFVGECILSFGRILRGKAAVDWRLFWLTMQECSAQALPIVGLISYLIGLILAFVGAVQLRQFGAGIYVANLVAVAMAREMAAIMTGVIMAGRTGAAFAAQIGSMKVSEEIDALRTLAISPMDFLVAPRVLALLLMMPLLCLYSVIIGILGGATVGIGLLNLTWTQYWNQTVGSMGLVDIGTGIFKGAVFGVIVALTGCQRGMSCGNNASAVGNAATSAVVLAITWIIVSDAAVDVIQQVNNL
jgi:phospholipid/cholesterol/gamma-HCH transport system permease protein